MRIAMSGTSPSHLPQSTLQVIVVMLASIQKRHAQAAESLAEQCDTLEPQQVVEDLSATLTHVRNLLVKRVHEDVEARFGVDSMLGPMSLTKEERELHHAKVEVETYMIVVCATEMSSSGYVEDQDWCIQWLTDLRLGDDLPAHIPDRIAAYLKRSIENRRLLFSDNLVRCLPEAHKAPLVVFRLFPKAVRLAVAMAFHDSTRAAQLRDEQIALLPAIVDCPQCRGDILDGSDTCRQCGNPLWNLEWLVAAD